jgi:signal transduction histidine kinase
MLVPEDRDRAKENIQRALSGEELGGNEYTALSKDGSTFPVIIYSAPIIYENKPVGLRGFVIDITERKQAEEELLAYQKELRSLASQLSLAEECERRRIATEVHDHIGQNLAICRMKLGSLVEAARSTRFAKPLSEIQTLIKRLIDEVRSLTFEVSSPLLYELGLEAAVEHLTEQIGEEHGIKFNFEDDGQPKPLDNDIRVLLIQAVRELLINITKHAQARYARVRMERHDGDLRIIVLDDGVGFDTSQISPGSKRIKGFGLFSIRERLHQIGGHIDIESEQGRGTQVTLTVPLKQT